MPCVVHKCLSLASDATNLFTWVEARGLERGKRGTRSSQRLRLRVLQPRLDLALELSFRLLEAFRLVLIEVAERQDFGDAALSEHNLLCEVWQVGDVRLAVSAFDAPPAREPRQH